MVKLRLSVLISTLLGTSLAYASEAKDEKKSPDLESIEVITTISRQPKSIQDTSSVVQSLSNNELTVMGVGSDFKNIQHAIAGLQVGEQEGKVEVWLRGIGSADSDFASDPSVAVHYNDVYLPRPRSIGPMFFDVSTVEVNKGPQGTLRGRNAIGGTINIISNRPELDYFNGTVTAGIGNYGLKKLEGVVNIPATDELAFRVAVLNESHDSFYSNAYKDLGYNSLDNPWSTNANFDAPGDKDDQAIRLSALWQPNDVFSLYVMADKVKQNGSGFPGAFTGFALGNGYDIDDLDDPYSQYFLDSGVVSNDIEGLSLNASYQVSNSLSVEYNASYRQYAFYNMNAPREWRVGMAFDGSEVDAVKQITEGYRPWGRFTQTENSETITNEIRFIYEQDKINWSSGLFYLSEEFSNASREVHHGWCGDSSSWFEDETVSCWWNGELGSEKRNDGSTVKSLAAFTDLTYSLTDDTRLLAGLRFTEDEKKANQWQVEHQIVVDHAAFIENGWVDENGNIDASRLIMASEGMTLTDATGRNITDIPIGGSQSDRLAFFLDGIQSWGNNDNLDDVITQNPDWVNIVLSSPLGDTGKQTKTYTEDYVDWRLGVEHDIDDRTLAYATISTGTRSGGFNEIRTLSDGSQLNGEWKPAKLTVYEAGYKTSFNWNDMPTKVNSAVFYYDYKDMIAQDLIAVPTPRPDEPDATSNMVFVYNIPSSELFGFEVDASTWITDNLDVSLNYSYLDSEIGNTSQLDARDSRNIQGVNLNGNMFANTSKHNLNARISYFYEPQFDAINFLTASLSAAYRSEFFLTHYNSKGFAPSENGAVSAPLESMIPSDSSWAHDVSTDGRFVSDKVDGYTVLNANLEMVFGQQDEYKLNFYVSNLNEEVYSSKGFINRDVNIRFLNSPRQYGVNFTYSFE